MCLSAEASYMAAAVLVPAGAVAMQRAYRRTPRYLPLATLPLLFGLQQLSEGLVWTANQARNGDDQLEGSEMDWDLAPQCHRERRHGGPLGFGRVRSRENGGPRRCGANSGRSSGQRKPGGSALRVS